MSASLSFSGRHGASTKGEISYLDLGQKGSRSMETGGSALLDC